MPTPRAPEGEKVRFVGKHSKDMNLSIYVQKRNIFEADGGGGEGHEQCESLGCIVRVKAEFAETMEARGQAVVVGVLARLVCDFGLQYTEHVLYQLETQLAPKTARAHPARVGGVFDFETRFVASLPDEWHIPFLVTLPPGLPPSVQLKNGAANAAHWGLTYYVFAYVTSAQSAASTLERHGIDGAWPRLRLGRRHSKVFLSFSKTNVASPDSICRSLPPSTGTNKRRSFLASGTPIVLEAALDRPAYRAGEPIQVSVRVRNSGRQRIAGIRVTLKQLLVVKFGNEPRQTIKTTVAEYEGHESQLRDSLHYDTTITVENRFNQYRAHYQLALESRLPRLPDTEQRLAASCLFSGFSWRSAAAFGIDRLRLFSVEYYVNVHAVIPWSSNVIVKLPFHLVSTGAETAPGAPSVASAASAERGRLPSLLKGNLISFDVEEEDGVAGADEIDLECGGGEGAAAGGAGGTAAAKTAASAPAVQDGVAWDEDLRVARDAIGSLRSAVAEQHHLATSVQLDQRSLVLQHRPRRVPAAKTLLSHLDQLILRDLPRLRASSLAAPNKKSHAAQSVVATLRALGGAHAALVPVACARSRVEERLELFSRLIDDLELFLVRAERHAPDAVRIVDRMQLQAARLVDDLPGYVALVRSLRTLRRVILARHWAAPRGGAGGDAASRDSDSDSNSSEGEPDEGRPADLGAGSDDTFEALLARMAEQFQALYAQIQSDDPDDADLLPGTFAGYTARLAVLLASDLRPAALAKVAFFHWRLALAALEKHNVAQVGSDLGRLLVADLQQSLVWGRDVEARVPARFLIDGHAGETGEDAIDAIAHQIVLAMQQL